MCVCGSEPVTLLKCCMCLEGLPAYSSSVAWVALSPRLRSAAEMEEARGEVATESSSDQEMVLKVLRISTNGQVPLHLC